MAASTRWGWSLSNLTHLDAAGGLAPPRRLAAMAAVAIIVSLLLHGGIIWLVLQQGVIATLPRAPEDVMLVRPPPVALPKPVPRPVPKPVAKPLPILKAPRLHITQRRAAAARPPPPALVNHFAAATDNGLNLNLAPPPGGSGHGNLDAFDDAVKQQIIAHKTYPVGLKGMWMECAVRYSITVDRSGQLLGQPQIFGCGNPFIDAAALAAILEAAPFPVPPDFGGASYPLEGSLIYTHH